MSKQKILLIGNGSSVLHYEYGDLIDSQFKEFGIPIGNRLSELKYENSNLINSSFKEFGIPIVRFNNYQIKGYEKYVGTKTNILARRCCDDVQLHNKDLFDKVLCVMTFCRHTNFMPAVAKQVQYFYGDKCELITPEVVKQTGDKIGLNQPIHECVSIGASTIDYYIKKDYHVILHGFVNVDHNNEKIDHYFPKQPLDSSFHNFKKERKWIDKLIDEGKISILSDIFKCSDEENKFIEKILREDIKDNE